MLCFFCTFSFFLRGTMRKPLTPGRQPAESGVFQSAALSHSFNGDTIMQQIFDHAPAGMLIEDDEGTILDINQMFTRIMGYSKAELVGKKVDVLVLKEEVERVHDYIRQVIAGATLEHEIINLRKDGSHCQILIRETRIPLPGGKYGIFAITQDINDRKQAERMLKENELKYKTLFAHANDAILLMTNEIFHDCNEKTLSMFGCQREDIIGRPPFEFSPNRQPDGSGSKHKALTLISMALSGTPQRFYWQHQKKDGTLFDAEVSLNVITIGEKTMIQAIVRDITSQKRVEMALRQRESQLLQLNATRDKFFRIIAHDLKSPFTAIIGLLDMLQKDYDTYAEHERKEFLENIRLASETTLRLLENLLQWSQAQTGELRYRPQKIDIHQLLSEVTSELAPSAAFKNIELSMNIPSGLTAFADPDMIKTVFRNLITNAIKFTFPFGKIMILGARCGNGKVDIFVEDNGIGIREELLPHLFKIESKYTAHGTMDEKGTGLGLILCHEFIERNGGNIKVTSQDNKGSRFCVTLPEQVTEPKRNYELPE